jgi:hypothetical protein
MDLERSIGDRRDASFYKHRHDRKHSKWCISGMLYSIPFFNFKLKKCINEEA